MMLLEPSAQRRVCSKHRSTDELISNKIRRQHKYEACLGDQSFDCIKCSHIKYSHQALCDVVQAQVRGINELKTRLTESERHERQQQLQRTMTLLVHASACDNQACPSTNCNKVKALFKHAVACQQKVQGGCHLCRSPPPHSCSVSLCTLGYCHVTHIMLLNLVALWHSRELNLPTDV